MSASAPLPPRFVRLAETTRPTIQLCIDGSTTSALEGDTLLVALLRQGRSLRVPGLHYAFGFNGEGFAIGPGVGKVMAELLATGTTSTPIEAFSVGRLAAATARTDGDAIPDPAATAL